MEFLVHFERALHSQKHKELMDDHVDNNEKPPLPFRIPIQHQMARIYTHAIIEMFEREDFRTLLCLFELIDQDEIHCMYKVSEHKHLSSERYSSDDKCLCSLIDWIHIGYCIKCLKHNFYTFMSSHMLVINILKVNQKYITK